MSRSHICAAVIAALLVLLQLASIFGYPNINFLDLHHVAPQGSENEFQTPFPNENSGEYIPDDDESVYLLGVGKADITGPVVEINLMGYADPNQIGTGLRQRLYSRAFIIGDVRRPNDRFVYLVLDTHSGDTAVRYGILEALNNLGPEYSNVYGQQNVAVTGTHSHSGPGAWLNYLLPQITSKGFDRQSYQAIVDGAVLSIKRAHETMSVGTLTFGSIEVKDANINRSPFAYLANPAEERQRYRHDVDKTLTMLKFQRAGDGRNLGLLTWFPVHGTSMLGNNTLISGDNKGVAADLFEKSVRTQSNVASNFVAAFSQANVGDTSPNILGAYCEDGSGTQCNFEDSTCSGKSQPCHGRGPRFQADDEGASSCFEIGRRQFLAAKTLYDSIDLSGTPIHGSPIRALHTFHDLSNFTFHLPNGSQASTCPAALGYSFAAGTTDGPGAFDFKQNNSGSPAANPIWSLVRHFIHEPSPAQQACQAPKPILLDVGSIQRPYAWTPNIVDIQLLRVGSLLLIVSPGEATTMAGRRWKEAIASAARRSLALSDDAADAEPIVVLGGPANGYTHYIATEEEYGVQRYEGASTLYGPHTLDAYIHLTTRYLPYLAALPPLTPLPEGPLPPNYVNTSLSFIAGVAFDRAPLFRSFGDVVVDAPAVVGVGGSVVVRFVGANPRNELGRGGSFVVVEEFVGGNGNGDGDGRWRVVRDDSDWDLVFRWRRTSTVLGTSEVEVRWEVGMREREGEGEEEREGNGRGGLFRIGYRGAAKMMVSGKVVPFRGTSRVFRVA